jgi:hypothetical protein
MRKGCRTGTKRVVLVRYVPLGLVGGSLIRANVMVRVSRYIEVSFCPEELTSGLSDSFVKP